MAQAVIELEGTIQSDGTLLLDSKLNLPAGPVRVTVESIPTASGIKEFLAQTERMRTSQQVRGHVPRSKEEIDEEIRDLRQAAEQELEKT